MNFLRLLFIIIGVFWLCSFFYNLGVACAYSKIRKSTNELIKLTKDMLDANSELNVSYKEARAIMDNLIVTSNEIINNQKTLFKERP